MEATDLKEDLRSIWTDFARSLDDFYERAARSSLGESGPSLHDTFRKCYWTPKEGLKRVLRREEDEDVNVGSATGLFFEQMGASLIEASIREQVEDSITFERNWTQNRDLRALYAQPDLLLTSPDADRYVVFEFKTAPKKGDLGYVREQRQTYLESTFDIQYFMVGGYVTRKKSALRNFMEEGWSTFLTCSDRNRDVVEAGPTLDDLVKRAATHLRM
jgi:hypothetical protein